MATNSASGLFAVWTDIAPEVEAEFNEWYDHEHVPQLLGEVPGFLSGRRYQAVAGQPKFIALYELADERVLQTDAFLKLRNNPTPWTQKMVAQFRNPQRGLFRQIFSYGTQPGKEAEFVMTARINPAPEHESEFNEWCNREHIPVLVNVPGAYRGRRYVAVEGDPKYLTVYEISDGGLPKSAKWTAASDTEWKSRIRPHLRDVQTVVARRIGRSSNS